MTANKINITTKKIARLGLFLGLALIVALIENMLPPPLPALPYAKIGFSNTVILACFLMMGVGEGYLVLVLKCVLASVFAGNISMMVYSLPAAIISYSIVVCAKYLNIFSVTGLSVLGGMLHNATQIGVAIFTVGGTIAYYMPYMLAAGALSGLVTGILCHYILQRTKYIFKGLSKI